MKLRVPLMLKILLPLMFLISVTVGFSGYKIYQTSTQRWQTEMDTRLQRVVRLLASTLDQTALATINLPTDVDTPEYARISDQLNAALTAGNLAWIGIYRREGERLYYWADSDATGVGYPFFYATPGHFAAFSATEPQAIRYSDEFGTYYGFVAPILAETPQGPQVIGIVEASLSGESRDILQQTTIRQIVPIMLLGAAAAMVVAWLITIVLFNRPLQRFKRGVMQLASGNLGLTLPIGGRVRDEISDLTTTFNDMSTQIARLYAEHSERERMSRELEIARTVQQTLSPLELPSVAGLEVAAICLPHRETSGDFYDVLAIDADTLDISIGDVSGKSIPAAMVMVAAYSTLRAHAALYASPAQIISQSNAILSEKIPRNMFVAVSYARLNARERTMVWANAGQIYPFLLHRLRPADPAAYPHYLNTEGLSLPMGMHRTLQYEDNHLQLEVGDIVLFYTDGVIEAMNPAREIYGFERLEVLVRSLPTAITPQGLLDAVLADVRSFVGAAEQHDDITVVAVKFLER